MANILTVQLQVKNKLIKSNLRLLFFVFFDTIIIEVVQLNNTANKKDIFYLVVLLLTFITVIVGATFALYAFVFKQEEGASAVYTGTLSIQYLSGEIISPHSMYPIEKPTIDTEKNVYKNEFKVTNHGSLNCLLDIKIEIKDNTFPYDDKKKTGPLKYSLYNSNGGELSEGTIDNKSEIFTIADNITLEHNDFESFTLIIWIQNDPDKNQIKDVNGKILTGRIRVDAIQKVD